MSPSATFSDSSVLVVYKNETTQIFNWRLEKDLRFKYSDDRILIIGNLVYEIKKRTESMYEISPLFGETEYRELYLIAKE